jgi:hypothetical protein
MRNSNSQFSILIFPASMMILKFALRQMLKIPASPPLSVLTLALGIGAEHGVVQRGQWCVAPTTAVS